MSIALTLVWILLVIAAIVTPIILAIWLFKKFQRIWQTLSQQLDKLQEIPDQVQARPGAPLRPAAILGQAEVLAEARQRRAEVRLLRYLRREERLQRARERWQRLGLVK